MRGVTATRAASSHKDEGKPSGKHANAPNNASNACAQDARAEERSRAGSNPNSRPRSRTANAGGRASWTVEARRDPRTRETTRATARVGPRRRRDGERAERLAPHVRRDRRAHRRRCRPGEEERRADHPKEPRWCANRRRAGGFRARVDSHLAERGGGGARRASVGDESEISRETNHLNRQRRGARADEDAEDEDADPVPDDSVLVPDAHARVSDPDDERGERGVGGGERDVRVRVDDGAREDVHRGSPGVRGRAGATSSAPRRSD